VVNTYHETVVTVAFHPKILRFDSIDSTNLEALRQAKVGAREGVCIVAREQTAGRGRLDRKWHSPKDAGIYFSIILRPQLAMSLWPLLTFMAALAVLDALLKSCGLRADIKWPNDIYVDEKKLCGILSETVESPIGPAAIVGIGINLANQAVPDDLKTCATSLEELIGTVADRDGLLSKLVTAISERYAMLQAEGGADHTIREWCANSSYAIDRPVAVSLETETFAGITRGVESDGALRVETPSGRVRIVRAGDVTALRSSELINQ
jgi:BirA family biotin operon repressor/biotin-[acetyl-CoA-carboxylase] ligase